MTEIPIRLITDKNFSKRDLLIYAHIVDLEDDPRSQAKKIDMIAEVIGRDGIPSSEVEGSILRMIDAGYLSLTIDNYRARL